MQQPRSALLLAVVCLSMVSACTEGDPVGNDRAPVRTRTFAATPPAVDLNGGGGGIDHTAAFEEGDGPTSIVDATATVADDLDAVTELVVTITNAQTGDVLDATDSGNVTGAFSNGVLTLSGTDTPAVYQTVLRSVTFDNAGENPDETTRSITFVATDDEEMTSTTATTTLTVSGVNDAPTVTDETFSIDENSANATVVDTVDASDPENDNLTFEITAGNTNNVFEISNAGVITVADVNELDHETTDQYTLTVEATDDGTPNEIGSGTITVNVDDVNEAPTIDDDAVTLDENSAEDTTVATVSLDDPDDGDTHTWSITAGNTGSAFKIDTAGVIAVNTASAVDFETNPTFSLTVEVEDSGGLTDTATIDIDLNDINDAPVVDAATVGLAENTVDETSVHTVTADDDEDHTLTWTLQAGNTGNAFAINETSGEITVDTQAALDFETTPSFTLTVRATDDGTPNEFGEADITINLTDVNEAPTVDDDTFNIAENASNNDEVGTVTFDDPDDGETFTFSITAGNTNSVFSITNAGVIEVNDDNELDHETTPQYTLTIEIEDSGTLTDTATVTVNVTDFDEDPTVDDDTFSVDENSAQNTTVGTVTASDPEELALQFAITAGNTGNAFQIDSAGEITVLTQAAVDFETTPTFTLTVEVTDQGSNTDTATVTVNLTNINEAPEHTVPGDQTVDRNGSLDFGAGISVADPDSGAQDIRVVLTATNGTMTLGDAGAVNVTVGDGTDDATMTFEGTVAEVNTALDGLTYDPTTDFAGDASVQIQTDDLGNSGNGGSQTDDDTVSIFVRPELTIADNAGNEGDAGNSALTFTITLSNAVTRQVTVNYATADGTATVANSDYTAATGTATIAANDTTAEVNVNLVGDRQTEADETFVLNLSAPSNATLGDNQAEGTINNDDNTPVADNGTLTTNEDTAATSALVANDDDDDDLTYEIVSDPAKGTIDLDTDTGDYTFTPTDDLNGADSFTFRVTDGVNTSNTATVTVTINAQNDDPTFDNPGTQNGAENATVTFTMDGDDVDGDTLTYTLQNPPVGSSYDSGTGQFSWTPGFDVVSPAQGSRTFTLFFVANDGNGGLGTDSLDLVIQNTNRAPTIDALAGDLAGDEGDTLDYTASASDLDGQDLTYTWNFGDGTAPVAGVDLTAVSHLYAQNGSFTVTLTVSDGEDSDQDTLSVVISNVAPTAEAGDDETVAEGTDLTLTGVASDPGDDTLTYRWSFGDGTPDATGNAEVTHAYGDNGVYTARFTVSDGEEETISELTVTVTNVAPSVNPGANINGTEGTAVTFAGAFTDPGADDTHTILWEFGNGDEVTGNLTPSYTYQEDGVYTATLTVTDDDGGEGSDTVTVTIANVAPTVDAGTPQTVNEGATINFNSTVTDPGNDTLTYAWDFGDGGTSDQEDPSHIYTTPDTYTVSLSVNDGTTTVTDTVEITVNNVQPVVSAINQDADVDEGTQTSFSVTASEPGTAQADLEFTWTYGDGNGADDTGLAAVNHTYDDEGNGSYTVTVTVDDGEGEPTVVTTTIDVNNVAPSNVDFGGDRTGNEGQTLGFTGSADDPSTDTLTYNWTFGDGNSDTGQNVSHAYADQGEFTITLTVSDGDGGSTAQTQTATISNVAPTVDLGDDRNVAQGDENTFTSSVTDPGAAENLFYEWSVTCNQGDFPGCLGNFEFNSDRQGFDLVEVDVTFTQVADYTLSLEVTDKDGASGSDAITVTVANEPPTVSLAVDDQTVNEGDSVEFTGSVSDQSEAAIDAVLNYGDNSNNVEVTVPFPYSNIVRLHQYTQEGSYQARLTATDNDNETADDTVVIIVANVPPSVTLPNQSANEGAAVTLVATANDPGDDTLTYTWDFGDGSQGETTNDPAVSHTYVQDGNFTLTLMVFDGTDTTTEQSTVTVSNIPPSVLIAPTSNGFEGVSLTFTAQADDPGDDTLSYLWSFGDGSNDVTTQTPTVSHTYADDESYTLTLTVSDGGNQDVTRNVAVTIANVDPVVDAGDADTVAEGTAYTFTGAATDVDADTLTYCWDFGDGSDEVCEQNPTHTYDDNDTYTATLTVTDEDGGEGEDTVEITVTNVNPVANAGGNLTGDEGAAVQFTGAGTDEGDDTLTYCWDFGDGSDEVCEQNPQHTYAQEGEYTVTLTVSDDDGGEGTDSLRVDVSNVAPTVDAGDDLTGNEGASISFTGTATDPGDDTLTYCWTFGDGSGEVCEQNPSHTYAQDGEYTATLRVDDGTDTVADTATITVNNVLPTIDAGDNATIDEGGSVTFAGTATDPGDDTLTYVWDFGDDTPTFTGNLTPTHTFANNGNFTVTLTVSDDDGQVSDTLTVTVNNVAPVDVDAGDAATIQEGGLVSFSGSAADPGADDLTYTWDFGDGTPEVSQVDLTNPSHRFTDDPEGDNDVYTVTLTVTDGDGGSTSDTVDITVLNVVPTAEAGDDITADEGALVNFNGVGDDVGDDVLTYRWTFGDGTQPEEAVDLVGPTHRYAQDGSYTVLLEVIDDDGGRASDTLTVTVNNVAPRLILGPDLRVDEGETVTYGVRAVDPGADDLRYTVTPGDGNAPLERTDPADLQYAYGDDGVFTATVLVDDQDGGTDTGEIEVRVANVAPTIVSEPVRLAVRNVRYRYPVIVTDPGRDDVITYTVLQGPVGMAFNGNNLEWVPDIFEGTVDVTISAADDELARDTQSFTITVGFGDRDNDGAPDVCEEMFEGLDPDDPTDGPSDPDNDCATVAEECLLGRHPLEPELPTAPSVHRPVDGGLAEIDPVELTVNNSIDPLNRPVAYTFEIFSNSELTDSVETQEDIPARLPRTAATVATELDENADYWWYVTPYADGCPGARSDVARFRFSTENDPASAPVPVAPMGRIAQARPTFVANNGVDPEGETLTYEFEIVAEDDSSVELVTNIAEGDETTVWDDIDFDLTENEFYRWRVRARDVRGLAGDWSDLIDFQINQDGVPPGAPTITHPTDGQVIEDVEAQLFVVATEAFDEDGDPLVYDFVLASDEALAEVVATAGGVEPTNGEVAWKVPGDVALDDDGVYWVGVTARDRESSGPAAKVSFVYSEANTAPAAFAVVRPLTDGPAAAQLTPEFAWRNTTDPEGDSFGYELEVYGDEALTALVHSAAGIAPEGGAETAWKRAVLTDNARFWWRVRAVDVHGAASPWTGVESFLVSVRNDAPSVPVVLSPENGAVFDEGGTATLVWEASVDPEGDAITYTLELFDDSGSRLVRESDLSGIEDGMGSLEVPVELPPGTYDWRVMASDGENSSAWSASAIFRIRSDEPSSEVPDTGMPGDDVGPPPTAVYPDKTAECGCVQPARPLGARLMRFILRR